MFFFYLKNVKKQRTDEQIIPPIFSRNPVTDCTTDVRINKNKNGNRKKLKILVIGAGGREHAIAWALAKSPRASEVVCAPGNAGIAKVACCVPVDVADLNALLKLVSKEEPDLVVIGPELPLSLGLTDELLRRGARVFGPTKAARSAAKSHSV